MINHRTLLLASVVLATAVAACTQQVCSLAGCASSVTVAVADFAAADRFDVVIDSDVATGSFGCVRGDDGFDVVEAEGDFAGEGGADGDRVLAPSCTDSGVVLFGTEQPTTLTVTITNGDDTHTGTFADIAYEEITPNGPDCEPACSFTTLDVE